MDELFRDSPTFVPGSKWAPSSYVNELAREIAKGTKSRLSRHSTWRRPSGERRDKDVVAYMTVDRDWDGVPRMIEVQNGRPGHPLYHSSIADYNNAERGS
ncbi:unnamed protein product [Aureobasidium pullulans]|nr:unnamed protein product [Aureobasidium pullulans]